jgi:hypothetical protein
MLFDYSYLTEKVLDELVPKIIKEREEIIEEDNKDRTNKYLFIALIAFIIFVLCVILLARPDDGNKAFIFIISSIVPFAATAIYLSEKVNKAEEKRFPLERVITVYIADDYHNVGDDSLFLSKLYNMGKLEPNLRKKINNFLSKENKDFQDYLDTLSEKELNLLAAPYRERLFSEIGPIVQAYLEKKQKEDQAVVQFQNKSKEFFYSTMPKNMANI